MLINNPILRLFQIIMNDPVMSFNSLFTMKRENERMMRVNTDLLSRVLSVLWPQMSWFPVTSLLMHLRERSRKPS